MSEDIVEFESEEILHGNYQQQQALSFADLETNARDWKMCEIANVRGKYVDYNVPEGYVHKQTEISKLLNIKEIPQFHCELCGHDIIYLHFIQCDFKKLYLMVGSECVNSFMGAKFVAREIKHFKDNQIRKEFREWKIRTLETLKTKVVMRDGKPVLRYDKTPMLRYWAYQLSNKIQKTDAEITTARKLKNLMKKGDGIIERGGLNASMH